MSVPDKVRLEALRLTWLRLPLVAGLIASLLLSPNLWVSARAYPLTPLWGAVPTLPYPADYALFGLFVTLVGVGITRTSAAGWLAVTALVVAAFFVIEDVSRLQPWFYQYCFNRGLRSVWDRPDRGPGGAECLPPGRRRHLLLERSAEGKRVLYPGHLPVA